MVDNALPSIEALFYASDLQGILTAMYCAAEAGGKEINHHFEGRQTNAKAAASDIIKDTTLTTPDYRDALTVADTASDQAIRRVLHEAYPDIPYVSEESEAAAHQREGGVRFLVDPLDGTSNFTKGSFDYSVTVAYQAFENGTWRTRASVVYDPVVSRVYMADEAHAYTCLLHPEGNEMLEGSLEALHMRNASPVPAFSGGWRDRLQDKQIEVAVYKSAKGNAQAVEHARKINGIGETVRSDLAESGQLKRNYSTALVLATMAYLNRPEGVILGGSSLNVWDVDAALHIVKQAGGFVSDPPVSIVGEPFVFAAGSAATARAMQAMVEAKARGMERAR